VESAPQRELSTAFSPSWVQNSQLADMWSGDEAGVRLGTTSNTGCAFLVVQAPVGERVFVLNPYTRNYMWLDAGRVTPVSEPAPASGSVSTNANCRGDLVEQPPRGTLSDESLNRFSPDWSGNGATLTDGVLEIAGRDGAPVIIGSPIQGRLRDVIVRGRMAMHGGNPATSSAGITIRQTGGTSKPGSGQAYVFRLFGDGRAAISKATDGQLTDIAGPVTLPGGANLATINDLTVQSTDDQMIFSLNGIEVLRATDQSYADGGVGLFADGVGLSVEIESFTVQAPY
jgi:hypothetical protein